MPPIALGASSERTALARMGNAGAFSIVGNSVSHWHWRSTMSKFVASMTLAVSFNLAAGQPAPAGEPAAPLSCAFWREICDDPFGCKAACAATAAPACPAPACAPAAEPVAPPASPEAPPAPATAQNTPGQRRSFSYDSAPARQASAARTSSRPVVRPVSQFRADSKLRGL